MGVKKMMCVLIGMACLLQPATAIVDQAAVYLPFEGDVGVSPNAEVWANRGTAGYETPTLVGDDPNGFLPTITLGGLNGQALDCSGLRHLTVENTYAYGDYGTNALDPEVIDTEVERALMNIWSFTVTGWIKNAVLDQGRILACSAFEINSRASQISVELGNAAPWYDSNYMFGSIGHWKFFAVTYDGTVSQDNLKFYYGSEVAPVTLDVVYSVPGGRLVRDADGSILYLGNSGLSSDRPFTGLLDELRIWANGPGLEESPDNSSVLSLAQLEQVRVRDLTMPNTCADVHRMGYGLAGDVLGDCNVGLADFSGLAATWLDCNDPETENCDE